MKFYDCQTAPSPRRARIFIAEKGVSVKTVEVDLKSGEHLKPEFKTVNPYCTVPVLELDDGTRLKSTAAIWHYLEAQFPEPPLMGATPVEQGRIADLQWHIEWGGFMAMADYLRNSAPPMKDRAVTGPVSFQQIPELAERGQQRIERKRQVNAPCVGLHRVSMASEQTPQRRPRALAGKIPQRDVDRRHRE